VVALGGDTRRIALSAAARKESVHSLTMTLPFWSVLQNLFNPSQFL